MPKRRFPLRAKEMPKKVQSTVDLTWDDDIESSDEDGDHGEKYAGSSSESEEEMTVEQKRKKIAQEYLASMKSAATDSSGDNSSDDEAASRLRGNEKISQKLIHARLESQGKFFSEISDRIGSYIRNNNIEFDTLSGHQLAVTCVALTSDDSTIYSGSKDNSVLKWDIESGARSIVKAKWHRKTHGHSQCHEGEVLSLAVSSDNKYLACGGRDSMIRIYDTRMSNSMSEIQVFQGHRGAVTSLAFQKDTYSLFSGSTDRCIKHWDLNEMGYLETLFGHQDSVNSLTCWTKQRPLSCSADRSLRMWKVSEDSHLVFRGHKGSIDNVQYMTPDSYISSGQDGSICVWKETQKKPIAYCSAAHGYESDALTERWITSLASCPMTDFAATGSYDGYLRLWNVNSEERTLKPTATIALDGFINCIALSKRMIVVGIGNEHRLGRWWRLSKIRNCIKVLKLPVDLNDKDGCYADNDDFEGSSRCSESASDYSSQDDDCDMD